MTTAVNRCATCGRATDCADVPTVYALAQHAAVRAAMDQALADYTLAQEIAETYLVTVEALTHLATAAEDPEEWRKSLAFALAASFGGDAEQAQKFVRAAAIAVGLCAAAAAEKEEG